MSGGGKSPRNEQEIAEFFKREKIASSWADKFYQSRGHLIEDGQGCKGWDKKLRICQNGEKGRIEKVEEKFRFPLEDGTLPSDVLIEIAQDLPSRDWGWFVKTRCDSLHYFLCTGEFVPFQLLRIHPYRKFLAWYFDYLKKVKKHEAITSPRGYGLTLNLTIKREVIPGEFIEVCPVSFKEVSDANSN